MTRTGDGWSGYPDVPANDLQEEQGREEEDVEQLPAQA